MGIPVKVLDIVSTRSEYALKIGKHVDLPKAYYRVRCRVVSSIILDFAEL